MILGWPTSKILSGDPDFQPRWPHVKLSSAVVAILVGVLKCRTQFWKRTAQESFQQSLVEIGSVVSEEKIFFKFHRPFFLICIAEMILRWSPFKIVSVSAVLYPRWPPLLKIEISSVVHCCFIINLNDLKCLLQLHGNE
jgi:hypothetical protein